MSKNSMQEKRAWQQLRRACYSGATEQALAGLYEALLKQEDKIAACNRQIAEQEDRITDFEKQVSEQKELVDQQKEDISKLKSSNTRLANKLDNKGTAKKSSNTKNNNDDE